MSMMAVLEVSRAGAYELVKSGGFPAMNIGSRIIVMPKEDFILWINRKVSEKKLFPGKCDMCCGYKKAKKARIWQKDGRRVRGIYRKEPMDVGKADIRRDMILSLASVSPRTSSARRKRK